ncbi:MAG: rhomboid family intramembrane serine protease [Planctomycetes bacterium]|nr:rhomboid family intramembrane serine protease [Planctomycetota bacterium]
MPRRTEDDDDLPVISTHMVEHEQIDFERGMNVVPPLTILFCLLCGVFFMAEVSQNVLDDEQKLIAIGAMNRPRVEDGQIWRLLSAAFLHGSVAHLVGNLIMLFILGMACEHAFGKMQFLTLFVASAIGGSVLSFYGGHTSVGASGAIFGLGGAIIGFFWRNRRHYELQDKRIGGALIFYSLYQLYLGTQIPEVDNRAHLGGLLGGIFVGWALPQALGSDRGKHLTHPVAVGGLFLSALFTIYTLVNFLPLIVR